MTGSASTYAGAILTAFDQNDDGILAENELFEFEKWFEDMMHDLIYDTYYLINDDETASRMEIARLVIDFGNVVLKSLKNEKYSNELMKNTFQK